MSDTKIRDGDGGGKNRPLTIRQIANALGEMADRYGDAPCYLWSGPITFLNVIPTTDGEPAQECGATDFIIELRGKP